MTVHSSMWQSFVIYCTSHSNTKIGRADWDPETSFMKHCETKGPGMTFLRGALT